VDNYKKISDHEQRVNDQLDGKGNECLASFGFHGLAVEGRAFPASIRCAARERQLKNLCAWNESSYLPKLRLSRVIYG
jgi:hypothetical protein